MPDPNMVSCCTCGYEWRQGQDGSHSCTRHMAKTIERLQTELDAERASLKPEIERLRKALDKIATFSSSEWPERCLENVRTARDALQEVADGFSVARITRADPGDAARMAARLKMWIDGIGDTFTAQIAGGPLSMAHHNGTEPDKIRAWCEAVALCADAVDKQARASSGANATPGQVASQAAAIDEFDAAKRGDR